MRVTVRVTVHVTVRVTVRLTVRAAPVFHGMPCTLAVFSGLSGMVRDGRGVGLGFVTFQGQRNVL